jgi:hypothetical protein
VNIFCGLLCLLWFKIIFIGKLFMLMAALSLKIILRKVCPEAAIVKEEEHNFVLIKKGKTTNGYIFEKQAVKVGGQKNGFVEILNSDSFEGKRFC